MVLRFVAFMLLLVLSGCSPANRDLILATTTSTQDSGLLDHLVPAFEKRTGYQVKTIAVGTGQALTMAERGDADVLLVHAPDAEKAAEAKGVVTNRRLVMYNDFILVGPANDPAKVKGAATTEALRRIAAAQAPFVSRGDDSGTHKKELALWRQASVVPSGAWYVRSGTGMGQTLQIAFEKQGYTLTDRGTYLTLPAERRLPILLEGDAALLNVYHVMAVNAERFPRVNQQGARAFSDFLTLPQTQELIESFGKEKFGQSLFFPAAGKKEEQLGSQP